MAASLVDRMIGAASLNAQAYEDVERDTGAMGQAMTVVVLSSVAAGIGSARIGIGALVFGAIGALVGWFIWAFLTYFIGTRILPEPQTKADMGELLRTLGFAASPGVFQILGVIPFLGGLVRLAVAVWMLAAMVVAVRQALDYQSTGRAVGVCVFGWLVYIAFAVLLSFAFAGMASLSGAMS